MAKVADIIDKAVDGGELTGEEIADLFDVPLFTLHSAQIQVADRGTVASLISSRRPLYCALPPGCLPI